MKTRKAKNRIQVDDVDTYLDINTFKRKYLIQPYIRSLTKGNLPYDIRIHVRRGENAEWKVVKIYPRIGLADGIVSNISQGGYITKLDNFLKVNFGDEYLKIKSRLFKFASEFPDYFQKGYDNYLIDALGIDIGIDENNKFWIFEVNSYPGSTFFELESQLVAMSYARYLAEKHK